MKSRDLRRVPYLFFFFRRGFSVLCSLVLFMIDQKYRRRQLSSGLATLMRSGTPFEAVQVHTVERKPT